MFVDYQFTTHRGFSTVRHWRVLALFGVLPIYFKTWRANY